jgi:UPF0271 protein
VTLRIDLNADLGEGMPWDAELLDLVTSANVSCCAHAGDRDGIEATLIEAGRRGVVVGAHPSWPDREGFGRRRRPVDHDGLRALLHSQIRWLIELARPHGISVRYVKLHGALYNQAMADDDEVLVIFGPLMEVLRDHDLILMGLPKTPIERMSHVPYIREGFPDRRYRDDGRLVPRGESGALIEGVEAVVEQALRLANAGLDSLCLHGDSPEAVARAVAIRRAFDREGIVVRSFLDESGRRG